MHTVPGMLHEGFGHKGGSQSMPARQRHNDTAQQNCVIGSAQRIASVIEIDLELTRRSFCVHRIG